MTNLTPRVTAVCLLALATALPGCLTGGLLVAAGAVESTKRHRADPLGEHEYQTREGTIGWYHDGYDEPREELRRVRLGFDALGCEIRQSSDTHSVASCDDLPKLSVQVDEKRLYRLCAARTDRMSCRMAWEKVEWRAPGVLPPKDEPTATVDTR